MMSHIENALSSWCRTRPGGTGSSHSPRRTPSMTDAKWQSQTSKLTRSRSPNSMRLTCTRQKFKKRNATGFSNRNMRCQLKMAWLKRLTSQGSSSSISPIRWPLSSERTWHSLTKRTPTKRCYSSTTKHWKDTGITSNSLTNRSQGPFAMKTNRCRTFSRALICRVPSYSLRMYIEDPKTWLATLRGWWTWHVPPLRE